MKYLIAILAFSVLITYPVCGQTNASISKPELRDTLIILLGLDAGKEKVKTEIENLSKTNLSTYIDSLFKLPKREQVVFALSKFKEIVKYNGLPTQDEIGNGKAFEATFMLTLHSGDSNFMKKNMVDLKTNFAPQTIAVLEDKINSLDGVPQIYGTQVVFSSEEKRMTFYKIANPSDVNQRRVKVGLSTLEKYAKEIGVDWDKENKLLKIK